MDVVPLVLCGCIIRFIIKNTISKKNKKQQIITTIFKLDIQINLQILQYVSEIYYTVIPMSNKTIIIIGRTF